MTSMNRRDVIGALAVLSGAAIARPVTALAQQPKRLRVGLKTAKALRITISPPILLRADEVLE
jgi:hypothetical protein